MPLATVDIVVNLFQCGQISRRTLIRAKLIPQYYPQNERNSFRLLIDSNPADNYARQSFATLGFIECGTVKKCP